MYNNETKHVRSGLYDNIGFHVFFMNQVQQRVEYFVCQIMINIKL